MGAALFPNIIVATKLPPLILLIFAFKLRNSFKLRALHDDVSAFMVSGVVDEVNF